MMGIYLESEGACWSLCDLRPLTISSCPLLYALCLQAKCVGVLACTRQKLSVDLHSETCAGKAPQCLHSAHPAQVWRIDALLMQAQRDDCPSVFADWHSPSAQPAFGSALSARYLAWSYMGRCACCFEPSRAKPLSQAFVAAAFGCAQQIPLSGGPCKLICAYDEC